jgi:mannonate dehydratase
LIKIAEMLPAHTAARPLWRLIRQAGVTHAVGSLPGSDSIFPGELPWEYLPLMRMKQAYESFGFSLDVIESRPPLNLAKRGLEGRDAEIAVVCQLIENMGRLGIKTWCYEWMADFNWLRTSTGVESRGGSLVSGYNHALMADAPDTALGPVSEDRLWESLEYFLRIVVPVAEAWNVQLAMHPDDPPLSPIRHVGRIMRSVGNYQRLLDLVPSPMNGITLCQGNFALMASDLPSVIKTFGEQGKIFFVHLRDVAGTVDNFVETWHDAGPTDLLGCLRKYRDVGFDGVLRPDHVPTVEGEANANPGYSLYGRLYAIGYIRGLLESVQGKGAADG